MIHSLRTREWIGLLAVFFAVVAGCSSIRAGEGWSPASPRLASRWAEDVSPQNAHDEYPRPQMVRDDWKNLNGLWQYSIRPRDNGEPSQFDGRILVPFPVESALSGVKERVGPDNCLWYQRSFDVPSAWRGERIVLHFEAVDWRTTMWVNGEKVGTHEGGFDAFSFDITDYLKDSGPQEVIVRVWDPSDAGNQPRGKQVRNPEGIWYTPSTGIWRTAWLEPVPETHIGDLDISTDLAEGTVSVTANCPGADEATVSATALEDGDEVANAEGEPGEALTLSIDDARAWNPENPFLYDLEVTLKRDDDIIDSVDSYFGMRDVSLGKGPNGRTRLMLNGKPVFQTGMLDQGFWPAGLYTAPTDEALRYDIEVTKKLGFNMLRKHVKVEPKRWYYWCDKMGVLVWQDMPSGDNEGEEAREQFQQELHEMVREYDNHPSIITWVPFNEGWGQHDTGRLTDLVRQWDPTRLVNSASGWHDRGTGDMKDIHAYPGPDAPQPEEDRAAVLGEFGGLGLPLEGHTWQDQENWGYEGYENKQALTDAMMEQFEEVRVLAANPGLSASVYTQVSDVETECNGVLTYDREVIKPDVERLRSINRRLRGPLPSVSVLLPTSQQEAQTWRYTTERPAEGWQKADFDDSGWKKGKGGFGSEGTPGAALGTTWDSSDIWLRRTFTLEEEPPESLSLRMHHDEDAQVYINGVLAAEASDYTTSYQMFPVGSEAVESLDEGENTIAVHCHQTEGGQFIDVGLMQIKEAQ